MKTPWEDRAAIKYGPKILEDFHSLGTNPYLTLNSIGKKYGFTRERARQIYNAHFGDYSNRLRADGQDLSCKNDPRHKVAEYKAAPESSVYKGALIEKEFFNEATKRGLKVKPGCVRSIDLEVNGHKVDVKSAHKTSKTANDGPDYLRFAVSQRQRLQCDFIACYNYTNGSFYIVPIQAIPCSKQIMLYIRLKPSDAPSATNRYLEYENRWELLE